ncbi:MAG TPA: hypothetical protein VIW29_14070 [Polyangiaceae bacterium]
MGQGARARSYCFGCLATLLLASRVVLAQPSVAPPASGPAAAPASPAPAAAATQPDDFALRSSPWIDVTLTNVWLEDRTSGFWNVGMQAGAYLVDRLRVSARLVVPLAEASDDLSGYSFNPGSAGAQPLPSRNVSVFYGMTVGLVVAGTKNFVFAPGFVFLRSDVNDYGSSLGLQLPFEWTTSRSMRVGFELSAGKSFGGHVQVTCPTNGADCVARDVSRPSGASIVTQFHIGWSLGSL